MTTIVPHRHALRRGTAAEWTADNPVLGNGEEGWETDTALMKVGDGTTAWTALPYANRGPAGANGAGDMTFTDNGDNTGTLAWSSGASSADVALLAGGVLPTSVMPAVAITSVQTVSSQAAMLALAAQVGDVALRTDTTPESMWMLGAPDPTVLANWIQTGPVGAGVASWNGQTGVIVATAADVGALASTDARVPPTPSSGNAGKVVTVAAGGGYTLGGGTAPTWTTPTIANATTLASSQAVRYCKDSAGWVHIEGSFAMTSQLSTYSTIFTLPIGYRPTANVGFGFVNVLGNAYPVPGCISTTGAVINQTPDGGGGTALVSGQKYAVNMSFYVGASS